MAILRTNVSVRGPAMVLVCALASIYTFAAYGLAGQFQVQPTATAWTGDAADTAAPDGLVQRVANSLHSVIGNDDELVVLPAHSGKGYTVTANVTLDSRSHVGDNWQRIVSDDMNHYFADVFSQASSIENAEIYFQLDGRLVAGAGLGRDMYKQLSSSVSTDGGTIVQSLAAQPVRTDSGSMDSWMEIESDP